MTDKTILVIGDVMLDRYVYGEVTRISPEAPVPVFLRQREECVLGGAANVAANVQALGGKVFLISVAGPDRADKRLDNLISFDHRILCVGGRITTEKTRYIAHSQQIMRSDREDLSSLDQGTEAVLLVHFDRRLKDASVIILSDYAKGVLTDRVISHVIEKANVPVIVDPKRDDPRIYAGATVITPNAHEAERMGELTIYVPNVIITRGAAGYTLLRQGYKDLNQLAATRDAIDVTGAGDTFVAALAVSIANGDNIEVAAEYANRAAGVAVSRRGTAVVSHRDMEASTRLKTKYIDLDEAVRIREEWRRHGLRVGFTCGVFDLLHPGHVHSFEKAKEACDRLIVAVNTSATASRIKGPGRPVQDLEARLTMVGAVGCVDLVLKFSDDTPLELLKILRPDVLVKGADYRLEDVVGADEVVDWGGEVLLVPLLKGHGTSRMIEKVRNQGGE